MIGDAGLGRSLVRIDDKDSDAWSTAFWGAILLMSALGVVVFLLSWPSAAFFNQPGLVPIMMTLALAPVLLGLVEIPAASLLQREKFHWLAGAEFAAAIAGIVVALTVAYQGGGSWALVWQHLTQRVVKAIVVLIASRFQVRMVFKPARLAEHFPFMRDTAAWSMVMFVGRQADTLIVGKFLGAATLGLYNIAVRIMQLPVNILGGSLHSAIYPRFVSVRENNDALRQIILFTTMAQATLVFPAIAAVAVRTLARVRRDLHFACRNGGAANRRRHQWLPAAGRWPNRRAASAHARVRNLVDDFCAHRGAIQHRGGGARLYAGDRALYAAPAAPLLEANRPADHGLHPRIGGAHDRRARDLCIASRVDFSIRHRSVDADRPRHRRNARGLRVARRLRSARYYGPAQKCSRYSLGPAIA
jgi:hypothetical protein